MTKPKHALPTAHARDHGRARAHAALGPTIERSVLTQPVLAIAQGTIGRTASDFAVEMVRALVAEQVAVAALVITDDPNADAQSVLAALHEAGARDTAWIRVQRDAPQPTIERALASFNQDEWVVVLGNTLPLYFRPQLCVFVTAPRATQLPEAQKLLPHAELQVSAPSAKLAAELAALIRAKALVRVPSNG